MKWTGPAMGIVLLAACAPGRPPAGPASPATVTGSEWVNETLRSLDLKRKVAQIVFPRIGGEYMAVGSPTYERARYWVQDVGVGGLIITIGPPLEMASKLNLLQGVAKVPVLVTADMEDGAGRVLQGGTILPYGMETGGATRFPPLMGFGATGDERLVYELGRITAVEGRAAGVHFNFSPVVDVNNNPANPIINTRSFGADATLVSRLAVAYIRGMQENGMLATAKHFPGHGDTQTDSHISLPVISVDRARADTVELPPYRAAFQAGVASIMSAHIAFPALTGDSVPGTLSPAILTGLLRKDLGFQGIAFTDAMDMGAITNRPDAARAFILALKAGADVLLQPDPEQVEQVIDQIVAAVQSGELSAQQIDTSVRRVLAAKQRLGLDRGAQVSLEELPRILGTPRHMAFADTVAQRSITAVRDRDSLLPLHGRVVSVVYTDDYDPWTGRTLQRELGTPLPGLRTVSLTERATPTELAAVSALAENADAVLFAPFIRVRAAKGGIALPQGVADWLRQLAARKPLVLTSFGNPYILQQVPELSTYVLAWGGTDNAQRAAARALTGKAPITGRLPISIPPLHQIGEGLQLFVPQGTR